MLALAAARLGMRTQVYEPAAEACAAPVVERTVRAGWDDAAALRAFAAGVDVATYEFENVPLAAVDAVAGLAPVRPGRRALEVAQDRVAEKDFLSGLGLGTAPYAGVEDAAGLEAALARIGAPRILKTGASRLRRQGPGAHRAKPEDAAARSRRWARARGAVRGCPFRSASVGLIAGARACAVGAVYGFDPARRPPRRPSCADHVGPARVRARGGAGTRR
jgi:5-(carboxyamino)imidazole ribonucleotide synthase